MRIKAMFERRYFLLSPNFHGATLLAKLLNAHSDIMALGDTYPSNHFDQTCGCGKSVSECDFWLSVKRHVHANRYIQHPLMLPLYPEILGGKADRWLYNLLPAKSLRGLLPEDKLKRFAEEYEAFLTAVYNWDVDKGKPVFVDGLKSVSRVKALLASGASVNGVIHMVRGPGDFSKSYVEQIGNGYTSLAAAGLNWRLYHREAHRLSQEVPYLKISYENLVDQSDSVLSELFNFMDVEVRNVEELRPNFRETWHFMGNISLMKFDGTLRRSQYSLTPLEKAIVRISAGAFPGSNVNIHMETR